MTTTTIQLLNYHLAVGAIVCMCFVALMLPIVPQEPPDDNNKKASQRTVVVVVSWSRHFRAAMLPFHAVVMFPLFLLMFVEKEEPKLLFGFFRDEDDHNSSSVLRILAVVAAGSVGLTGLGLFLWTNRLFHNAGGTLGPWDPPQSLVIKGPYCHVRNPMLAGVLLMLVSESMLLGSACLVGFSMAFFIFNTLYFMLKEEPLLRKRYGTDYNAYVGAVPRWIPRMSPYTQQPQTTATAPKKD